MKKIFCSSFLSRRNKNTTSKLVCGFTLIELLVVIAIIALLSSITMAAFNDSRQKSRDTGKIRALQEMRTALQMYFSDNNSYPVGTESDLSDALTNGSNRYIGSIDSNLKYQSLNSDNTAVCTVMPCHSYHLATPLERTDNKVLTADKDLDDTIINGTFDNCSNGAVSVPNLCYDITP
jgi:prepilin-type N-terminal cleavage/methylation domain-containing protein